MTQLIKLDWLIAHDACGDAITAYREYGKEEDLITLLNIMIEQNKLDWANWLIVRKMTYDQYVSYAVYAAEQVIHIYEQKYPDDHRPRNAISAAKACIGNIAAKAATKAAAKAAYAAANAAFAAAFATDYAAYAAYAAAKAAYAAANAAFAAANAAGAAAGAASAAGAAAYATEMKIRILKYGILLLKEMGK